MKRSEMLNIMAVRFAEFMWGEMYPHQAAERLLSEMEELGMQPPGIIDPADSLHPESNIVNEWTKEDHERSGAV